MDMVVRRQNPCPCQESNPSHHPAQNLVTILTELHQFLSLEILLFVWPLWEPTYLTDILHIRKLYCSKYWKCPWSLLHTNFYLLWLHHPSTNTHTSNTTCYLRTFIYLDYWCIHFICCIKTLFLAAMSEVKTKVDLQLKSHVHAQYSWNNQYGIDTCIKTI
jgi:hypothetical protein